MTLTSVTMRSMKNRSLVHRAGRGAAATALCLPARDGHHAGEGAARSVFSPARLLRRGLLALLLATTHVVAGQSSCPADLTGDGRVDGTDLGVLLGAAGGTGDIDGADLNGDGIVDGSDLGLLLAAWGDCPRLAPPVKGGIIDVRINEFRATGKPSQCAGSTIQYAEIAGPPGQSLDGLTYLVIGHPPPPYETLSGVIRTVIPLDGLSIAPDGLFLIARPPVCNVIGSPDLTTTALNLQTGNATHLIVLGFSGSLGQDLDVGNDCVLDVEPWVSVIDSVAIWSPDDPTCTYAPRVNPDPETNAVPAHAFRCEPYGLWKPGTPQFASTSQGGYDTPGMANALCVAVNCPGAGDCCTAHGGLGCNDVTCCDTVCSFDLRCCEIGWDASCAAIALALCACDINPPDLLCPDQPDLGSCFVQHNSPGCDTLACQISVCDADPTCCSTAWDQDCVHWAIKLCPCGNPNNLPCWIVHDTPGCSNCDCCTRVCDTDAICCNVAWDAYCVGLANVLCATCGEPNAGRCCYPHPTPSCDDPECCALVCDLRPLCCIVSWDVQCSLLAHQLCTLECTACGSPESGDCFVVNMTAGCQDELCCVQVCGFDPYCCDAVWDQFCVQAAGEFCILNIPACIEIGPGVTCLQAHDEPGCSDPYCCELVCTIRIDCCDIAWDETCAIIALNACSGCGLSTAGPCMIPHAEPFCDYAPCCDAVCQILPDCCTDSWDASCVSTAESACCGMATSGSCFEITGSPFCNDPDCCSMVCNQDLFCCITSWDDLCLDLAFQLCAPQCSDDLPGLRSCFIAHGTPGCDMAEICATVCEIDEFCCTIRWDAVCVQEADAFFNPFNCPEQADCYEAHPGTGCAKELCCKAVCSLDVACCEVVWDDLCAVYAGVFCNPVTPYWPYPPSCPGEGSAFQVHNSPGAADAGCCLAVCAFDPFCCNVAWDSGCVAIANGSCLPPQPAYCFYNNFSCFDVHGEPGCNSAEVSEAVCIILPSCCESSWDLACVSIALNLGIGECGTPLAGDCLTPRLTPFCDDFACCAAVCEVDDFCCEIRWDTQCTQIAFERCNLGSCYEQFGPGCSNPELMAAVCGMRPECCSIEWDAMCVEIATKLEPPPFCGEAGAGDCFLAHSLPSCSDVTCCTEVCDSDPVCCEASWDSICASEAKEICSATWLAVVPQAGDVCAGPCFSIKDTPFCNDAKCSDLVCAEDDFCCTVSWDDTCVIQALTLCRECGDFETGDCCSIHPWPFCSSEECCETVCGFDPFCCEGEWDTVCVSLAVNQCDDLCPGCGDPGSGDCLMPHGTPFCDDEECCEFICQFIDSYCCEVQWDDVCAEYAIDC